VTHGGPAHGGTARGTARGAERPSVMRQALVLLATLLPMLGGCVGERERLDVPLVALDVDDGATPAGGRITGRAAASDASGLISLAVYACSPDSVFRMSETLDRAHSAAIDFSLHVATNATPGQPVEVYTVAYDDQGFARDSARVVFVGGVHGDPTLGAGLCTRPRAGTIGVASPTPTGP
jgi:hypothetical protein